MDEIPQTKRCGRCGEIKPVELFFKDKSRHDGFYPTCKTCYYTPLEKPDIPEGMKRCYACKQIKPTEMFYRSNHTPDGLKRECKECIRAYQSTHKESLAERRRERDLALRAREYIDTPSEKRCTKCQNLKPASEFHASRSALDGLSSHCKRCHYQKMPETIAREMDQASWPEGHRRCIKCREIKPFDDFHLDSNAKNGRTVLCKLCAIRKSREWVQANPEQHRVTGQAWVEKNREKSKEIKRDWSKNNPDKVRSSRRASYVRNRAKKAAYWRMYIRLHPDKVRANNSRRRARLALAQGSYTDRDIEHMRAMQQGHCAYCGRLDQKLTADHIIPLFQGGSNGPENLCLACGTCNSSKGARTPEEWVKAGRWFDTPKHTPKKRK